MSKPPAWVDVNSEVTIALPDDPEDYATLAFQSKRAALLRSNATLPVFRSLIRSLYIVLDCSQSLTTSPSSHLPPTKHACLVNALQAFIASFFSTNPTSSLGIILMNSSSARLELPLTPGPGTAHTKFLQRMLANPRDSIDGLASVTKGLEVALESLSDVPMGSNREVLMVYNSCSTTDDDPSRILALPAILTEKKITVTTISTEPEIYALRNLTVSSGGQINTVQSADHLRTLLNAMVPPPPTENHQTTVLQKTAFPTLIRTPHPHLASTTNGVVFTTESSECPVCRTSNLACPGACSTCGIKLARSVDLVRCARNLRPVQPFTEMPAPAGAVCRGCAEPAAIKNGRMCKCNDCGQVFCFRCDQFIHEDIRTCPGCVGKSSS